MAERIISFYFTYYIIKISIYPQAIEMPPTGHLTSYLVGHMLLLNEDLVNLKNTSSSCTYNESWLRWLKNVVIAELALRVLNAAAGATIQDFS